MLRPNVTVVGLIGSLQTGQVTSLEKSANLSAATTADKLQLTTAVVSYN